MAKTSQVIKDQVRTIYYSNGRNLSEASRLANVPIDRAEKWKEREHWDNVTTKREMSELSEAVRSVADNVANEIADCERETRLGLARYSKRAAKSAEEASLRDAPYVHKAAQVAGIAFKWDTKEQANNTVVNVAILGVDPASVSVDTSPVIDVDSTMSE